MQEAQRHAVIVDVGEAEDRQQFDLIAFIGRTERAGDQPLHRLIEQHRDRGGGETRFGQRTRHSTTSAQRVHSMPSSGTSGM